MTNPRVPVLTPALRLRVHGAGCALPTGEAITNLDLLRAHEETRDKPDAFLRAMSDRIENSFGFSRRYMTRLPRQTPSGIEETSEDLALKALREAIGSRDPAGLDALVVGTTTTSRYTGSQAASIAGKLGSRAAAFEVKAGCSTSLASLHCALSLMAMGYRNVAVVAAETLSKVIHPEVRETWFGLADGAGALWLERVEGGECDFTVQKTLYGTDGRYVDLYTTRGILPPTIEAIEQHGFALVGDSSKLRELAQAHYLEMLDAIVPEQADRDEIRWMIPHQVNRQLVDFLIKERSLTPNLVWHADQIGNIGGASVLYSLARSLNEGKIKGTGDKLLMASVGGGLSFAAQLWQASRS